MNSRNYRISDAINGVMPSQNAGDTYAQDYTDSELTALSMELRRRKRNIRNIADHADVKRLRLSLGSNCVHQSVGVPQPVSEDPKSATEKERLCCLQEEYFEYV